MAACAGTDPAVADKVAAALKKLDSAHTAATAAKIIGWAEPADYTAVRECLTVISYGAFAAIQ
jgi:hypothetical protein